MTQRLRKSRLERQAQRPTGATSDREPKLAVNASKPGNPRKLRLSRVPALTPEDLAKVRAIDPSAKIDAVRKGKRYRAHMVTYTDPSKIKPKG